MGAWLWLGIGVATTAGVAGEEVVVAAFLASEILMHSSTVDNSILLTVAEMVLSQCLRFVARESVIAAFQNSASGSYIRAIRLPMDWAVLECNLTSCKEKEIY